MKFEPRGQRGVWSARWKGKKYPVVHLRLADFHNMEYRSPRYNLHKDQYDKLIADIHEMGEVIIAKSQLDEIADVYHRTGYHSLWKVANVRIENDNDVVFDLLERVI